MRLQNSTLTLLNEIELAEGEITEQVEQKMIALCSQVDQAGLFIKRSEAVIEHYLKQIEDLKVVVDRLENANGYLKKSALEAIKLSGSDLKGESYTFSLRRNPPKVIVKDESMVSDFYKNKKEIITVDKKRIKEAFDNGVEVDGAEIIQDYSVKLNLISKKQIEE